MDKVTRNAGYFLSRFRDQCLAYLKTHSAGDYEAAMMAIVEIIEREQKILFEKEEDLKRDKHGGS
ncbi:MAG: hypothetical protein AAB378_02820 [Patescibacteria group bacterium]